MGVHWGFCPVECRPRQMRKRSTDEDSFYETSFSFSIKISLEGAISLGLVQLPGICLGLLGLFKTFQRHGLSKMAVKDTLRSCLLFFLPYFLVELLEFVHFFLSTGVNICCGLAGSKLGESIVKKFDLLFFLGNKDKAGKAKILSLDAAKVFFGSVLQFSVQLYLIEISVVDVRVSQYLSVISSLLLMCKTGYEVMTYARTEEEKELSMKEKAGQLLRRLADFLAWLPLIGSNLVFKLGLINLALLFLGWYALLAVLLIFLLNLFSAFLATNTKLKEYFRSYKITHKNVGDYEKETTSCSTLELIYTSYTNIFLISRIVARKSSVNMNLTVLLQPLHFVTGLIFISVFKSWDFYFYTPYGDPSYQYQNDNKFYNNNRFQIASENTATGILLCGFLSLFLCLINWEFKIGKKEKDRECNAGKREIKGDFEQEKNESVPVSRTSSY